MSIEDFFNLYAHSTILIVAAVNADIIHNGFRSVVKAM